jgi:Glyoxalase/Bleomycin resistance protein/Dioxygenase superfamily
VTLHSFLGMEIGVPAPDTLAAGYSQIGLLGHEDRWGTQDCPDQIRIVEAPYRQLRSMRIGCHDERDLAELRHRLEALGIEAEAGPDRVTCPDPSGHWRVVVEIAPPVSLSRPPPRIHNRPGERARTAARADVVTEAAPRPPRRLGHVVLGSPDPLGSAKFFLEGIGLRMSDQVAGLLTFMRCSRDHHNLLIQPAPVPYLNHYAFEYDDIDAVGAAARHYLDGQEDRHVVGLGRHVVGSNVFWYVNDPCGTMVEFFSDMDDIPDDDAWEPRTDWEIGRFSSWGPKEPPHHFAFPPDLDAIGRLQEAERR